MQKGRPPTQSPTLVEASERGSILLLTISLFRDVRTSMASETPGFRAASVCQRQKKWAVKSGRARRKQQPRTKAALKILPKPHYGS